VLVHRKSLKLSLGNLHLVNAYKRHPPDRDFTHLEKNFPREYPEVGNDWQEKRWLRRTGVDGLRVTGRVVQVLEHLLKGESQEAHNRFSLELFPKAD
jgi:hypothetical protein